MQQYFPSQVVSWTFPDACCSAVAVPPQTGSPPRKRLRGPNGTGSRPHLIDVTALRSWKIWKKSVRETWSLSWSPLFLSSTVMSQASLPLPPSPQAPISPSSRNELRVKTCCTKAIFKKWAKRRLEPKWTDTSFGSLGKIWKPGWMWQNV